MPHSVIITTPRLTLDELGKELGLTKAEQKFIIRLVDEKGSARANRVAGRRRSVSSKARNTAGKSGEYPVRKKSDCAYQASA